MQQRSPIIVWLLFAANLCADAVALSVGRTSMLGEVAFFALITGQLSTVCIWSALRLKPTLWSRIAPGAAVVASALPFGLFAADAIFDLLPFFGLQALGALIAMWILRRSSYWRRRTGVETEWQFSIAQLLIAMTVVALLAVALRHSELFDNDGTLNFAFLCGSVALATASVFVWSRSWHWLLRLAGVLATAIGLGVAFYFAEDQPYVVTYVTPHFLIQGFVLATWLGGGQILSINGSTAVDAS